jgi:hypothetical protein
VRRSSLLSPSRQAPHLTLPFLFLPTHATHTHHRELEEESERIRTFYTRKVDEVQKKAEAQLRALKRTGSSPSSPADGSDPLSADAVDGGGAINSAAMAVREEYEQRLKMLEEELVRNAAELGAARRELSNQLQASSSASTATQAFAAAATGAPSFVSIDSVRAHPSFESEVNKEAELRTMRLRLADLEARAQAPLAPASTAASSTVGTAPHAASTEEVERLQHRLRLEEDRCRDMQIELSSLRARANDSASNAPSLAVLQVRPFPLLSSLWPLAPRSPLSSPLLSFLSCLQSMEAQLSALESRLQRRERELTAAVEEGRSASKIERARLEALHAAELRERDEQLVKFQQELETLVYALRQWQHAASAGGEASTAGPSFHPMPATNLPVFV